MSTEQISSLNENLEELNKELNNELQARKEKLIAIRKQGIAFPNHFRRDADHSK